MQYFEVPEFPVFHGEKAIKFLRDYINGLEEQRSEELTEKQATALIKVANGLISSIEAEKFTKEKPRRKNNFLTANQCQFDHFTIHGFTFQRV